MAPLWGVSGLGELAAAHSSLAAKKARGEQLGRPRKVPAKVRHRIERERKKGKTLSAIADGLNDDQVPTARGGKKWWPETVRIILAQS
jgi:hypothetical protein